MSVIRHHDSVSSGPVASATPASEASTALDKALTLLQRGVADYLSSEGWRKALAFRSRFHSYSFFNSSLIQAQCPEATLVAGYKHWQSLGRQVKRGEKGILILAPILRKVRDDDSGKGNSDQPISQRDAERTSHSGPASEANTKRLVGFRSAYVFDLSQTEGDPIPEPAAPQVLTGDSPVTQQVMSRLLGFCNAQSITVAFDFEHPRALGAYYPGLQHISLKGDLPPLQSLKTLIHEVAHALLHNGAHDRGLAELEAESCAFLVCHQLGIDTAQYSFPYLAHWSSGLESLLAAGEKASKAAVTLLAELEKQLNRPQESPEKPEKPIAAGSSYSVPDSRR